jgi:methylenetetrahydrofolate--tRNA-(uracil-5-)-methyltransferase
MLQEILVIGGGLAGCEAAWQLAKRGIKVKLYEMRGAAKTTPAHKTDVLAELVCSNSFRSDDVLNAVGLLHEEMRRLGSLIMWSADKHRIPAGSALAVDREVFALEVQQQLAQHPNISIIREEVSEVPQCNAIIATGPLTGDALANTLRQLTGYEYMAFFDAIAPIVEYDSIDFDIAWMQSRYDKGEGKDYINCPFNKEEYYAFVDLLIQGEKIEYKEWEKSTHYFNGCLPVEVMAERGVDTLRFGPMKPVGLTDPKTDRRPFAVLQLRQDNKAGSLFNMVGFQTKLKYPEQVRIFRQIPGLSNANFVRLGGLHRNTFINSPKLLTRELKLKHAPNIRMCGQIIGVEGYLESAAMGLLCGLMVAFELNNAPLTTLPEETALGALLSHITGNAESDNFQPMNINFGLFPTLPDAKLKGDEKKKVLSNRALQAIEAWARENGVI